MKREHDGGEDGLRERTGGGSSGRSVECDGGGSRDGPRERVGGSSSGRSGELCGCGSSDGSRKRDGTGSEQTGGGSSSGSRGRAGGMRRVELLLAVHFFAGRRPALLLFMHMGLNGIEVANSC